MILLAIFILMVITGHLLKRYSGYSLDMEMAGEITAFVGYLLIGFSIISLPISHLGVGAGIEKFKSVEETLKNARTNNVEKIESAAFQMEVSQSNKWLASAKYYNSTSFDMWVPDEVDSLKPIK